MVFVHGVRTALVERERMEWQSLSASGPALQDKSLADKIAPRPAPQPAVRTEKHGVAVFARPLSRPPFFSATASSFSPLSAAPQIIVSRPPSRVASLSSRRTLALDPAKAFSWGGWIASDLICCCCTADVCFLFLFSDERHGTCQRTGDSCVSDSRPSGRGARFGSYPR